MPSFLSAQRALGLLLCALLSCASSFSRPRVARADDSPELRRRIAAVEAARPRGITRATLTSVSFLVDNADRIQREFPTQSDLWRDRADRYLDAIETGRDPYPEQRGLITNRGYVSPISTIRQGYSIYLPPNYEPTRRYPLLIMLHGGSSNGNLFLGVVLGNNMDWLTYDQHLWDEYTPRWRPDWIVVAPDGFGQVLWRWMGERDVLDVIDDVVANYNVDADHIVLGGLSNGGLGTYAIGTRHASRFALVTPIAGAPSWVQYTGGRPNAAELRTMLPYSGFHLIENSINTDFRFYHGTRDPGPMRPAFVTELEAQMNRQGLTPNVTWYDWGHDLLYLVHRHGRFYTDMLRPVHNASPARVVVRTGDYRANRQHWVTVTRIADYPTLARVEANAAAGSIVMTSENAIEVALDLRTAPIGRTGQLSITADGHEVYRGGRGPLGHVIHLARPTVNDPWRVGFLPRGTGFEKRPGVSGPIADAYFDGMIHVYGTQDAAVTARLRTTAERGARGWPLWLWNHSQRVVADTEVTDAMMRRSHLVLYGTPGSNSVLERIADQLPIRVTSAGVTVGSTLHPGADVGTRFIHPNPLSPERYVIVQAGATPEAVSRGHNLPDFVPDYVVYNGASTATRPRLITGRAPQLAMGFFDRYWRLPTTPAGATPAPGASGTGASGTGTAAPAPAAPPAAAPAAPTAGPHASLERRLRALDARLTADDRAALAELLEGADDGATEVALAELVERYDPSLLTDLSSNRVHAGLARLVAPPTTEVMLATSIDPGPEPRVVEPPVEPAPVVGTLPRPTELYAAARSPEADAAQVRSILGLGPHGHLPTLALAQAPPITLPRTRPPPTPAQPTTFLAPARSSAGVLARALAHDVATFTNFRAVIRGGTWLDDPDAVFSIRDAGPCVAALDEAEVTYHRVEATEPPVVTPVAITSVGGIALVSTHSDREVVVTCEMALRLLALARVAAGHGVRRIHVMSSHRTRPAQSFHTLGFAVDIHSFETADATWNVETDFVETPDAYTCESPPASPSNASEHLLAMACELAVSHAFSTVLTPNYNDGHRNHFHLDARPDDPRVYVR